MGVALYIEFNVLDSIAENLDDSLTLEYPCGGNGGTYITCLYFIYAFCVWNYTLFYQIFILPGFFFVGFIVMCHILIQES